MRDREDLDPLARQIEASLRSLASPRAPASLLPRVLGATTLKSAVPWYARQWQGWTPGLRVAAALVGLVAVLNLLWLAGAMTAGGWAVAVMSDAVPETLQTVITRVSAVVAVMTTIWQSLGAPLAAVAAPIVIACGVACAGCGLALRHLVPGGTVQS